MTKYDLLHHSRTYTKVYIGIESTCIHKGHLNNTAFNLTQLAQLVEHQTSVLRAVGSSPTVSKNFSC